MNRLRQLAHVPNPTDQTRFEIVPRGFTVEN